jgi:predicted DNA-binding WGR domain protein
MVMSETKTYLELSEAEGSHKFYEVVVNGTQVTVRYGRIGDNGQSKTTDFPSAEKAQADATKKINEKMRKGYEQAVVGVRQKRAVTRRTMASVPVTRSQVQAMQAPVLWKFATGSAAFGIFVDQDTCWVGNQTGRVFALDHSGQVKNQFQLPDGVKCLVADDVWIYAGCDDGKVYDLGGKVPRVAYEIANNIDIFWLDIADGILGVSDQDGQVTIINHEDESQWSKRSSGNSGWMVRCDEIGVYHGHGRGVTMYDWEDGRVIWNQPTDGAVLFGWQEESLIFAGTSARKVYCFTKQGKQEAVYQCDSAVFSCAAAEDGKYVFAGDNDDNVYCFNQAGERLWKLATGCGSVYSMQFFEDRLYLVTTNGSLACVDASEAAIQSAQAGTVPTVVDIKAPKPIAAPMATNFVETTNEAGTGVLVECFAEGSQLRIRAVSPGYDSTWRVQFPRDIREVGARYVVEKLLPAARGNFYRTYGEIRKLV